MSLKLIVKMEIFFLIILIIPSSFISGATLTYSNNSQKENSRSDEWILDLQKNGFNNPQWYYINLDDGDRKKIRQAFDYMIDRDHIINDIEQGLGLKTFSFISPTSNYFLDNGTKPRSYDKDKAKSLLSEVFGYTYDSQIDDPNTSYNESFPYFNLTFLVPNNNVKRVQYGRNIATEWNSIGIEVNLKEEILSGLPNPIWLILEGNASDFNHGGYDVELVGLSDYGSSFYSPALPMSLDPYLFLDPYNLYNSLNVTFLDSFYKTIFYDQNETKRNQAIQNYQQWLYDNVPESVIYWAGTINLRNKGIEGINEFARTNYENWTYNGHTNVTILARDEKQYKNLNPVLYTYEWLGYPDGHVAQDALYRGLFYTTTENNQLPSNPITYPYFADWYNKSADGLTWFVNMKQGLKWHDGVELNTSDVKFTFDYQKFDNIRDVLLNESNPEFLDYQHTTVLSWITIGNLSVDIINSTLVKFTLENPYNYFKEDILTMKIIPKHILKNVSYDELLAHFSNTGINGPVIGSGPYSFVKSTTNPVTLTLQKWQDWDTSYNSLIANNKMNQILPSSSVPTLEYLNFITIGDEVQALEALKNGTADITLNYGNTYDFINLLPQVTDPIKAVKGLGHPIQYAFYNVFSPIWGLNPIEPCTSYKDVSCDFTSTTESHSTSKGSPIDLLSIFFGFFVLSIIVIYSRKKH